MNFLKFLAFKNPDNRLFFDFGSESSTTSENKTTNETTSNIHDSRVAANDQAIVAGEGATLTVTQYNADAAIIKASSDAIATLAAQGLEGASTAAIAASKASEASSKASESASYNSTQAAIKTAEAASKAAEAASYNATSAAVKSAEAAAKAIADANYNTTQAAIHASDNVRGIASDALYSNETISKAALDSNRGVAADALLFGENAVNKSIGAVSEANKSLSNTAYDALHFRADETTAALDFAGASQKQTNDLIRYTNEQFTSKLASNAGDAPQNTVDNIIKYLTIGATILGVVATVYSLRKKAA